MKVQRTHCDSLVNCFTLRKCKYSAQEQAVLKPGFTRLTSSAYIVINNRILFIFSMHEKTKQIPCNDPLAAFIRHKLLGTESCTNELQSGWPNFHSDS